MAPRRKIPIFLLPVLLILLAGAVVLLLRGQPVTLERIFHRQGYAITGQTGTEVTLTLSRDQMPEGFPEEVSVSDAEGELEVLLYQEGDTSFYLTAFAQSSQDSNLLQAGIELRHQLSREGGELLLPYQVNGDGSITVGLDIDRESVRADGGPARGRAPGRPEQRPVRPVCGPGPLSPLRPAHLPARPLLPADLRARLTA